MEGHRTYAAIAEGFREKAVETCRWLFGTPSIHLKLPLLLYGLHAGLASVQIAIRKVLFQGQECL